MAIMANADTAVNHTIENGLGWYRWSDGTFYPTREYLCTPLLRPDGDVIRVDAVGNSVFIEEVRREALKRGLEVHVEDGEEVGDFLTLRYRLTDGSTDNLPDFIQRKYS